MRHAPLPPAPSLRPPARTVPGFAPLRPGGRHRLRRAVRRRRRVLAAGLAVSAAALAAAAPRGEPRPSAAAPVQEPAKQRVPLVSAPVRIADSGAVRLLRPGDRVDVLATGESAGLAGGGQARMIARAARIAEIPESGEAEAQTEGALVVLSVPRPTARALAGAGASKRLAVVLC